MCAILVTGGAGFIGSHVCKELKKAGFLPIAYDNLSNGNKWSVKYGPFVLGDILDKDLLIDTLKKYNVKAVCHLAAKASVHESINKPLTYYETNVSGTTSLLLAMQEANVTKLIFSSSCSVYGIPNYLPIDENHPKKPISPYGETKAICETLLQKSKGVDFIALRYFNAAGADEELEIGLCQKNESNLIPKAITAALTKKAIPLYGNTYNTEDGTAIRDYVHVTDIAIAHVKALTYILERNEQVFLNIGTETGYSIKTVLSTLSHIMGKDITISIESPKAFDPEVLVANTDKVKELLKWEAKNSSIAKILTSAVEFRTNNHSYFE